ncbi:hypothetical protein [Halobacterium sp. CBA1126]|uniref:hypothetical protein n=1 Tax=Halobacterium sp. CBA1126 TaxID=2668074 RepID=UPI0012F784D7|nr:hypothetical protein [Halobacterium sp. CBA1126]MUV60786.1 hypothetical protein [Halobacterium sp. CBA1126]
MNANRLAAVLVALTVAVGASAGVATAATDGSLVPHPSSPGETSTHFVTATAGSDTAGSWNGFEVDYSESGATSATSTRATSRRSASTAATTRPATPST